MGRNDTQTLFVAAEIMIENEWKLILKISNFHTFNLQFYFAQINIPQTLYIEINKSNKDIALKAKINTYNIIAMWKRTKEEEKKQPRTPYLCYIAIL